MARGEVLVHGAHGTTDVVSCSRRLRNIRRGAVAMVFQQFALLPWRTVRENVGFGLELAGVPDAERNGRVDKQLELVGLTLGQEIRAMSCRAACSSASASPAPSPPKRRSC